MQVEVPDILVRQARKDDLRALVAIFAADALGGHGDTTDPEAFADYARAFTAIETSPNQMLHVAEVSGEVVGTFQTMMTTSLTGRGSSEMIIEAVQTRSDMRGQCDTQGTPIVSMKGLGFKHSHLGFKMALK